jgi:hypothetical protein
MWNIGAWRYACTAALVSSYSVRTAHFLHGHYFVNVKIPKRKKRNSLKRLEHTKNSEKSFNHLEYIVSTVTQYSQMSVVRLHSSRAASVMMVTAYEIENRTTRDHLLDHAIWLERR